MAHEYVKRTPRIRGVQLSVQNNAHVLRQLEAYGYRVIRFRNEEVLSHLPSVLERIRQMALAHNNRPPKQPRKRKAK